MALQRPGLDPWLAELTGIKTLTPGNLEQWQYAHLRNALARAKANSPFYATHLAAAEPDNITGPKQLAQLPFMDGTTLANEGPRLLCVPLGQVERIRTLPTSGSTGVPKRVWFTEGDMERTVDFFSVGMRPLVSPGETVGIFMGQDKPGSIADLLRQGLARIDVKAHVFGADIPTRLQDVTDAHCLVGMPAHMLYLCRKAPKLHPKTVLLSADYISPAVVNALEREWGCQVFAHYGLTETCYGLAVQCGALGMQHLRAADFIVEIIDPVTGRTLPTGQEGEIVLTSLRSEAMPLVRYRTGDVGSLISVACRCGSIMPGLGPVRGRLENLIHPINIHMLDDVLFATPGLVGYHASWQGKALSLTVEGALPDEKKLQEQLGVPVQVQSGAAPPFGRESKRTLVMASD